MDCTRVQARGRRLLTLVLLLLSLPSAVGAQPPVPVYEVGAGELSIDGSLEDWRRLSIPPVVTELDVVVTPQIAVEEPPQIPPPGAPDLTFEVRLAWSAEPSRIFAAFEIADDHYLEAPHPDRSKSIYPSRSGDVLGLEVDGDHGGGQWEGFNELGFGCECCAYLETREGELCRELRNGRIAQSWEVYLGPDGFSLWNWSVTTRWQRYDLAPWPLDSSFTAAAGRIEPGGPATIEMMIAPFDTMDFRGPEYSTPSRLSAGQTIGLEMYLIDKDPEGPGTAYLLGNPEFRWYYAESFADALLVPAADRATGVERTSWGRLKGDSAAGD